MLSFAHCSILRRLPSIVCALVVLAVVAWAQRPVVPPPHPPMPTGHPAPAPIVHPPIYQPQIMRPPVTNAPIYNPPRYPGIPSTGVLGGATFHPPIRPIHPRPPVVLIYSPTFLLGTPYWQPNSCWSSACDLFWPWTFSYTNFASPGPTTYVAQVEQSPMYVYGQQREDTPQLYLKDGTILNVTDYWVVDGQLYFTVVETPGTRPVERSIPFEALDLQKTVDADTALGFRFVLRNEPVEQYLRDHPEGPPLIVPPK